MGVDEAHLAIKLLYKNDKGSSTGRTECRRHGRYCCQGFQSLIEGDVANDLIP